MGVGPRAFNAKVFPISSGWARVNVGQTGVDRCPTCAELVNHDLSRGPKTKPAARAQGGPHKRTRRVVAGSMAPYPGSRVHGFSRGEGERTIPRRIAWKGILSASSRWPRSSSRDPLLVDEPIELAERPIHQPAAGAGCQRYAEHTQKRRRRSTLGAPGSATAAAGDP